MPDDVELRRTLSEPAARAEGVVIGFWTYFKIGAPLTRSSASGGYDTRNRF